MAVLRKTVVLRLLLLISALFILSLAFKVAAENGSMIFSHSAKEVRSVNGMFITPSADTYTIWLPIYIWQFLIITYLFTTVIRNQAETSIATLPFFCCYAVATTLDICFSFVGTKTDEHVASFALLAVRTIFLCATFAMSAYDFYEFLKRQRHSENVHLYESQTSFTEDNGVLVERAVNQKTDAWMQRLFVQNGMLFYCTWSLFESILHLSIVLLKDLDLSDMTSSIIGTGLFFTCVIVWFYVENVVRAKFLRYTISEYIAVMYAVTGVFYKSWDENRTVGGLNLALLIITVILFDFRLLKIWCDHKRSSGYLMKVSHQRSTEHFHSGDAAVVCSTSLDQQ